MKSALTKRQISQTGLAAFLCIGLCASSAHAVSMDFDGLMNGPSVGDRRLTISAMNSGPCYQLSIGTNSNGSALCEGQTNQSRPNGITRQDFVISGVTVGDVETISYSLAANARTEVLATLKNLKNYRVALGQGGELISFESIWRIKTQQHSSGWLGPPVDTERPVNLVEALFSGVPNSVGAGGFSGFGRGVLRANRQVEGPRVASVINMPLPASAVAFVSVLIGGLAARRIRRVQGS
ncbi:MAG: hypothetical protein AAF862_14080 [Pseudomonadota bacterium]